MFPIIFSLLFFLKINKWEQEKRQRKMTIKSEEVAFPSQELPCSGSTGMFSVILNYRITPRGKFKCKNSKRK